MTVANMERPAMTDRALDFNSHRSPAQPAAIGGGSPLHVGIKRAPNSQIDDFQTRKLVAIAHISSSPEKQFK
jgi:hypothetical protein